MQRPDPSPVLNLPEHPTVDQTEDALARERSRLTAYIAALREEQQKDEVQMAIDQTFKAQGIDFAVPQIRLQPPEGVTPD